jgi:V8-like Glu-specific endopeptidase
MSPSAGAGAPDLTPVVARGRSSRSARLPPVSGLAPALLLSLPLPVSGLAPALLLSLPLLCTSCDPGAAPAPRLPAAPEAPATARQPVSGGEPAPDEAAAVAISLRSAACAQPATVVCSGALVSSRVVLTAGHCAEPYARGRIEVWTGAGLGDPDLERRAVSAIQVHPEYDETASPFDAAVLHLATPLDAPLWPLPKAPMDATWVGRTVRVLGFGEPASGGTTGERRAGTAVITAVTQHTFTMAPDPALTCRGDSGGPVLADIDGTTHLVGITSAGDAKCTEWATAARVDSLTDNLLAAALAEPPEDPPITPGEVCAAPCTGDVDCPADLVCAGDGSGDARCVLPGLEPGGFQGTCDDDAACAEGPCVSVGDECRCLVPCEAESTSDGEAGCSLTSARGPHSPAEGRWLLAGSLFLLASVRRTARRRGTHDGDG